MDSSAHKEVSKLNTNAQPFIPKAKVNPEKPSQPILIDQSKMKDELVILSQKAKEFVPKEKVYQMKEQQDIPKASNYVSPYTMPKLFEQEISGKVDKDPNNKETILLSKIQQDTRDNKAKLLKELLHFKKKEHDAKEKIVDKTESELRKGSMDVIGIVASKANEHEDIKEGETKKEYKIEFLLTFKNKWYKRPYHMNVIDVPILDKKSRISPYKPEPKVDPVKEIRILLNKLAEQNFDKIYNQLIKDFEYTPELLESLATILFNMAIKEPEYVRLYIKLFDNLFSFFKPKEVEKDNQKSKDLDLRRIIINKVQNLFEGKFADQPLSVGEDDEKLYKKKIMFLGNTRLIGELFIRGFLPESVIIKCFEKILKNENNLEEKLENCCILLESIGYTVYLFFASEVNKTLQPKLKLKSLNKETFDQYIDTIAEYLHSSDVSSKIKLRIQDIINSRDLEWLSLFKSEEYIPKKKGRNIIYQKKSPLKAQDDTELFESKLIERSEKNNMRKMTLNEQNLLGQNLENFRRQSIDNRLKVDNLIEEYLNSQNFNEAVEDIKELNEKDNIEKYIIYGLIIKLSFAKNEVKFEKIVQFLLELCKLKYVNPKEI